MQCVMAGFVGDIPLVCRRYTNDVSALYRVAVSVKYRVYVGDVPIKDLLIDELSTGKTV